MSFILGRFGLNKRIIDIIEDKKITDLRVIQKKALMNGLLKGNNIFIAAPSASGKTFIGEIAALQNILNNKKKSIFLVPLRALANEKYNDFITDYLKLGINISISTGDFDVIPKELEHADLIICTYERFDSLIRDGVKWLNDIGTVVVDEIHIINDYNRGPRLENLLARLKQKLPDIQLIALSATIANPEELADWLGCELIRYEQRPIPLKYIIHISIDKLEDIKQALINTVQSKGQILVFTRTRKEAQFITSELVRTMVDNHLLDANCQVDLKQLVKNQEITTLAKLDRKLINTMKFGVAYHHAGLSLRTRKLVETTFRKRLIKAIICTTTLAQGLNLPAQLVLIKDVQVITRDPNLIVADKNIWWKNQLDRNLFHQILGLGISLHKR